MCFDVKIEDAYYMGMLETTDGLCFTQEPFYVVVFQGCMEYFDGGLGLEAQVLTQIDLSEATRSQ